MRELISPSASAQDVRLAARHGHLATQTSRLAPGHIQANLLVVPRGVASDFELLCLRNPVSCPLLGQSSAPGDPYSFTPPGLFRPAVAGGDEAAVDIRKDIPQYNVYLHGKLIEDKTSVESEWQPDSVAFLIGCSFSFEAALAAAGLPPRHWTLNCNVPMYRTKIKLFPAGIFTDAYQIVSMRPYKSKDIEQVRNLTRPYVKTHGEPVAWGWEAVEELGIRDIQEPEFGDAVSFAAGEVPVFWVCLRRVSKSDLKADNVTGLWRNTSKRSHGCWGQDRRQGNGTQAGAYAHPRHHREAALQRREGPDTIVSSRCEECTVRVDSQLQSAD